MFCYCALQVLGDGAHAKGRIKLFVLLRRRQNFPPLQEPHGAALHWCFNLNHCAGCVPVRA